MSRPFEFVGEAPGRLDVLGGVADYSGACVLQTPTRSRTRVVLEPVGNRSIVCASELATAQFCMPLGPLVAALEADAGWKELRGMFAGAGAPRWSLYPLGCVAAFGRAYGWRPQSGFRLSVTSGVPQSMGVSSSAALEIAALRALSGYSGIDFDGNEIAHLGQQAENFIVGAPCGLMDQLAAAFGEPGSLLPILCRPDQLDPLVRLPAGVTVIGWPSGVRHSVAGSPYAVARCAAFMAKRILETALGGRLKYLSEAPVPVVKMLCALMTSRYSGEEFLLEFDSSGDALTSVDPAVEYPVAAAASFAVEEHGRSLQMAALLQGAARNRSLVVEAGSLMTASHRAYGDLGLGSPATDAIAEALSELGPSRGVYGARISGGGGGGTVVALVETDSLPAIKEMGKRRFGKAPSLVL